MIENTFLIAQGIGAKKERALWDSGILTWNDFLQSDCPCRIGSEKKRRIDCVLNEAYELLDSEDSFSLGEMLKSGERWRLYDRFKDKAAYLDIETDGLDRDSLVTVVTVHKKDETVTLTQGFDLDAETLSSALDGCKLLITFNGSCFDVPVLKCSFPTVDFDIPQFDLRFGCQKVGMSGGLKNIEIMTGIERSDGIQGVDGEEAVRLWKAWERHRDRDALNTLIEYNRADTVNLERLSEIVYGRLVDEYAGFSKYL